MRIRELVILAGTLAGSGCLIGQDLGETAGDESGSASDGSSGGPSTATDDASVSLSGTSAQPGDDGSGSSGESDSDSATTGDDTDDGGVPGVCDPHPQSLQYDGDPAQEWEIGGVAASETAVLAGPCTMQQSLLPDEEPGPPQTYRFVLSLECALDGAVDGNPIIGQPYSVALGMYSIEIDPELLPLATAQDVQVRLAYELVGYTNNLWVVIEREDGTILLDMISAIYIEPTDPELAISDEATRLLQGQAWHGGLEVSQVPTRCETIDGDCGAVQKAIELGWEGTAQAQVEVDQIGTIHTDLEETRYRACVRQAAVFTKHHQCLHMAKARTVLAIWAEEP